LNYALCHGGIEGSGGITPSFLTLAASRPYHLILGINFTLYLEELFYIRENGTLYGHIGNFI
jgi:hypothetical protein